MDISKFSHLVAIEEASRRLTIFRLSENGEKTLYTQIDLPSKKQMRTKQLTKNLPTTLEKTFF